MQRTTLEEARPPLRRTADTVLGAAMLRALRAAARRGLVTIPIPEPLRDQVCLGRARHSFHDNREVNR